MDARMAVAVLVLVIFISGCAGSPAASPPAQKPSGDSCSLPKKKIGNVCCLDQNENGVCDIDDVSCPSSCDDNNTCTIDKCSKDTSFKCVNEPITPCCGNGICEHSEDIANICPQDGCYVINMKNFSYSGTADYMENDKYVFIHTSEAGPETRLFQFNISAGATALKNAKYTFKCNATVSSSIDSITSVVTNITDANFSFGLWNVLENSDYVINTNFYTTLYPNYRIEFSEIGTGKTVTFQFRLKKKDVRKRDELTCAFLFYFSEPKKIVEKRLVVSYI